MSVQSPATDQGLFRLNSSASQTYPFGDQRIDSPFEKWNILYLKCIPPPISSFPYPPHHCTVSRWMWITNNKELKINFVSLFDLSLENRFFRGLSFAICMRVSFTRGGPPLPKHHHKQQQSLFTEKWKARRRLHLGAGSTQQQRNRRDGQVFGGIRSADRKQIKRVSLVGVVASAATEQKRFGIKDEVSLLRLVLLLLLMMMMYWNGE